jgi:chromosome segregation ATPase
MSLNDGNGRQPIGLAAITAAQQAPQEDLSEHRRQAVEHGLVQYQRLAHERDDMAREVSRLRQELAELRVMVDAHDGLQAAMESRAQSAVLARDQAIADRVKWEGLFTMINATLRAFEVPAAPLIVEARPTAASAGG